jgi:hypothetical protein
MRRDSSFDPLLSSRRFSDAGGPEPGLRTTGPARPENLLVAAVLEDAVRSWRRCRGLQGRRAARLRDELREWFLSDAVDWPFSFVNVCEHLDRDPVAVRALVGLADVTHVAA